MVGEALVYVQGRVLPLLKAFATFPNDRFFSSPITIMSGFFMQHIYYYRAFSLVELSIVLVILGLLTGGVLAGQSLIRAAELRSVASEALRYQAALMAFRDRYMELPGDMVNATRFWGAADAGDGLGADCFTVSSNDKATCNGDGDGYIRNPQGATGLWTYGERWHAWKQLANAGLVEGSYTGSTNSPSDNQAETGGVNVPFSKYANNIWLIVSLTKNTSGNVDLYDAPSGNMLHMQKTPDLWSSLSPEEMWNIDVKIDDGKPAYGKLQSAKSSSVLFGAGCTTSDVSSAAEYNIGPNGQGKFCHFRLYVY